MFLFFSFIFRGLIVVRNYTFVKVLNISNAIKAIDGIQLIYPLARLWARALYPSTHMTPTSPPSLGRHHLAKGFKTKRQRFEFGFGGLLCYLY